MNARTIPLTAVKARPGDAELAARLRREVEGEVLFDAASRGRYATDASIYQIDWAAVLGSLAGVLLDALGRAVSSRRKEG